MQTHPHRLNSLRKVLCKNEMHQLYSNIWSVGTDYLKKVKQR